MIKNQNILIVGGSKGLGLSIASLLKTQNNVYIASRTLPDIDNVNHIYFDANNPNLNVLPENPDIVIISCGVGELCEFSELTYDDIVKNFSTNCVTQILIIKKYYSYLLNNSNFKLVVISSINSFIGSPLFSVYGSTKTAISKFIENINAEMMVLGHKSKIINIIPSYIEGTSFYGEHTELLKLSKISEKIIESIDNNETLVYVPDPQLCLSIIDNYNRNKVEFYHSYYNYKKQKNQSKFILNRDNKIGYLSGSFDYLHIGHINLIKQAKTKCDYLIVGVHKDGSHKNKTLHLSLDERIETLRHISLIDEVIVAPKEDTDFFVQRQYDFLFVGDDYRNSDRFTNYEQFFSNTSTKIIYFPYTKNITSTEIRNNINNG